MKNKTLFITWLIGFLLLNLYVNGLPILFRLDVLPWIGWAVMFFVVAHLVAKFLLRVDGLSGLGLSLKNGWVKWTLLGFILGFGIWALKYWVFYQIGKFEVEGTMGSGYIVPMLAQAMLGMLLASAINDVMIRGYWLAYCKKTDLMKWYLLIVTILYAFDDFWIEGIDLTNLLFSAVLGISLAYTVVKTGTIWMAIGIHWGGNMMYRTMFGFDGQGVWHLDNVKEGLTYELISIFITALLFPVLYLLLRNRKPTQTIAEPQPVTTPEIAA